MAEKVNIDGRDFILEEKDAALIRMLDLLTKAINRLAEMIR